MPTVDQLTATLRAAGCVFAEVEAALLLAEPWEPAQLAAATARRVAGEPLEQVLGWAELAGVRVHVEPGVFVPRRRSELLVREAARRSRPGALVVELCCGTGAVGAALAARVPVQLHAADLDPAAVACARRNLPAVHQGDLYGALPAELRGRVEVLVCNAPYVPTADLPLLPPEARLHEPALALDGGLDGIEVQRRVASGAPSWLAPGGVLLMETSARQAVLTLAACRSAGLQASAVSDQELAATVVVASAPGSETA